MWPFSRTPLLDADLAEWMFDHAEWMLGAHSRATAFVNAKLIPVSDKMFPPEGHEGHALAEHLLARVLHLMNVSNLTVRLVPEESSGRYADTGNRYQPQQRSMPAGTYRGGGRMEITYDTTLLQRPVDLVAVLAHEVAHAVLDLGAFLPPPSHADLDEMLTDFTAIFLGFGLFQIAFRKPVNPPSAEVAKEFKNLYSYYMTRREGCCATALFCLVHDIEPALLIRVVDLDARSDVKRAFRDLEAHRARIETVRRLVQRARAG